MDMAKFESAEDDGFEKVVGDLRRWVKDIKRSAGQLPQQANQRAGQGSWPQQQPYAGLLTDGQRNEDGLPSPSGDSYSQYNVAGKVYNNGRWAFGNGNTVNF